MTAAADVPTVELSCEEPDCTETFVGPAEGAGSAKFKLASHRYRIHGIKADGTRRPPAGSGKRTSKAEDSARPAVAVVRDLVRPIEDDGKGPPSERALTQAFGHGLELLSISVASLAAETEEGLSDAQRDEITKDLSLSGAQAREIARPIAHLVQPTKVNSKFGRQAVENVDAFAAVLEIVELGFHWRRYMRQRAQRRPIELGDGSVYVPPAAAPAPAAEPDVVAQRTSAQDSLQGVVVSAEMVEQARRRGGNG